MTQNMYVQLTKKAAGARCFIETDTNKEKARFRAIFWQKHTLVWKEMTVKYGKESDQK